MKRALILLITLIGSICLGCGPQDVAKPAVVTASPTPATVGSSPTTVDEPGIVRRDNGTVIKKAGWKLPVEIPADKQYHETTAIYEGRKVTVLNSPFFPKEKLVTRIANLREPGDTEYEITQIIEFTDRRKRTYCYQLIAGPAAAPVFFSYLDADGDGIYETLGPGCTVPDWVK